MAWLPFRKDHNIANLDPKKMLTFVTFQVTLKENEKIAVIYFQQFEFALMKMRGTVDYEFLVKLRHAQHPKQAAVATTPHSPTPTTKANNKS